MSSFTAAPHHLVIFLRRDRKRRWPSEAEKLVSKYFHIYFFSVVRYKTIEEDGPNWISGMSESRISQPRVEKLGDFSEHTKLKLAVVRTIWKTLTFLTNCGVICLGVACWEPTIYPSQGLLSLMPTQWLYHNCKCSAFSHLRTPYPYSEQNSMCQKTTALLNCGITPFYSFY